MAAMQQSVDAYAAANAALRSQVDALESSGNAAGSASAEARETAYSLANASTIAQGTLTALRAETAALDEKIAVMDSRLEELSLKQAEQLNFAVNATNSQQELLKQATLSAANAAAKAAAVAQKAEAKAAQALRDLEAIREEAS